MPRLSFTEHQATIHKAIVAFFDLCGFSDFCNQPEASIAAPRLIKRVFDLLNALMKERNDELLPWMSGTGDGRLPDPSFIKFLGDGALMLWARPAREDFSQGECDLVVHTMRNFQRELAAGLPLCEKEFRVHNLPKRARMGIATGIVYALRPPHAITRLTDPMDYVGYCINLAVRLQNHCPKLGFLVHGDLHPGLPEMEPYLAVGMKGSQPEPVWLFREDIGSASQAEFGSRFKRREV